MKLKLLRWLLPAIVPAALMFGAATSAHATQYNCDGPINPVPTHVNGDADVSSDGDCVVDHSITATGAITFNVTGKLTVTGDLTAEGGNVGINASSDVTLQNSGKITSGRTVYIKSVNGAINVAGEIKANTTQLANSMGNVLLQAFGDIATGNIITGGNDGPNSPFTGAVQIDANQGGGNTEFIIGGSSGSNGINGFIDTRSTTGGDQSPPSSTFVKGGVRITNGNGSSTGGIRIANSSAIRVTNSNSKSGWIVLNAWSGTIFLDGNLSADGAAGKQAGNVFLFAKTIDTVAGTTISASQTTAATASGHQIVIAADDINFAGGENGLTIKSDGNSVSSPAVIPLYALPSGSFLPLSNDNVSNLSWTFQNLTPIGQLDKPLKFNGAGSASLLMSANGDNTQVYISGYPIQFSGGDVTIEARGKTNHKITMGYFSSFSQKDGLIFLNTGRTLINATATNNGDGGDIVVNVDSAKFLSARHIFRANSPNNGSGKGGNITYLGKTINVIDDPRVEFEANGGDGKGGNIFFKTDDNIGDLYLGKRDFSFSATGGLTGTTGSIIIIEHNGSGLTKIVDPRENEPAVNVSASNGNGGFIKIGGSAKINMPKSNIFAPTPGPDYVALDARGNGSGGLGGTVYLGIPNLLGNGKVDTNIMALIKVDGSSSLGTTDFAGKIGVDVDSNAIFCRQWKTGLNYPKTYWNCASPDSPDPSDIGVAQAANNLPANLTALLSNTLTPNNPSVQVFLMGDLRSSYHKFFFTNPKGPFDFQYGISNLGPNRVAVAFALVEDSQGNFVSSEAASGSGTNRQGTIIHELGHHVDWIVGLPSNTTAWTSLIVPSFNSMNALPCANVFFGSTCNQYPNLSNSQIFIKKRFKQTPGDDNVELFAAMFEHVLSEMSGTPPLYMVEPELEKALKALTQLKDYMTNQIVNNPGLTPVH